MRGDIIYRILDLLEDGSMAMANLVAATLTAGYGASMNKIDYHYEKRKSQEHTRQITRDKKRNLQKYIYKLKDQGMLSETNGQIAISSQGHKKLKKFQENKILQRSNYKKEPGDKLLIVSYDVPVFLNKERDILRGFLKLLGFQMIHKSVWIGKVKLPPEFILALGKLKILEYTQILEVSKQGTLRDLGN